MKHSLGLGNPMVAAQVAQVAANNPDATAKVIDRTFDTGEKIVGNYFNTVKTVAKVGGIVVGGGIATIGLFVLVQKLRKPKGGKSDKTGYEDELPSKKDDFQFAFSEAQFKIFASTLEEAFWGKGVREDIVVEIIKKMPTREDFYKLVDLYGERDTWKNVPLWSDKGTLIDHLISELADNKKELKQVKDHLASLGVYLS